MGGWGGLVQTEDRRHEKDGVREETNGDERHRKTDGDRERTVGHITLESDWDLVLETFLEEEELISYLIHANTKQNVFFAFN